MADTNTYEYFLNNSSQGATANNTHTFSNLFDDTSYTLKVVVTDKAGLTNEAEVTGKTNLVPAGTTSGAITFTNPTWSGGKASIKVSTNTGYKIEYQINGTTGTWTEIASGGTISNLAHNTNVYARLTDGINSGEYASTSIKDTVQPTVSVKSSNVTYNSATLTVTATDSQSGIKNYQFFLGNTSKATQTGNTYNYTGLAENTSYTLKVIVTDNAGNQKEASTSIKTGISNVAPQVASVTYSTKTTNSLTIKARATDGNSSDRLTYTLYTSTSENSGFTSKATVSNQVPGTEVTLTASGLSQYTQYYYYVTVSDGKASAQSGTQGWVRTYCPGNTYRCTEARTCSGQSLQCPGSTEYASCSNCGGDGMYSPGVKCNYCSGSGKRPILCPHGKLTSHKYCEHGRMSAHTIKCEHNKTSSHYYCDHNYNGVQHD